MDYREEQGGIRADAVLPPGTLLAEGKYCLEAPLGRGGFGITYAATQRALGRTVAIKEYFPRDGEGAWASRTEGGSGVVPHDAYRDLFARGLERFIREGHLLAEVTHPHVVQVFDLFEEHGTAYLVMERIAGRSLYAERLAQPGEKLPPARAWAITAMLVDALALLHERHIYHLDIKPENILLTPEGRAVLIDFGAARQEFTRMTRDGRPATRIYTPGYAPPEVQQGGPVGPESDIYELGMTLHELLTGALPPPEYARPRSWTPRGVGEPWRSLIARAVAARREDRPRDVRAWWAGQRRGDRRALIGIAEGAMAICTRVSCWWRRGRRHALVGIAAVVLAGAAALLIYQPPRQEPPVSPPTPPAPTATTTVIPPPTPQERPVTHTPSTATTTHPVSRPTTPPASSPTSTRPVAPPASGEATKPAPLGGAPTAAELPGLLGYTNYLVSVGDRLIYGMGVAKDRRAAEVMAKRHLLAGLRTLPGRAGAGPDALHGAQRNQEIRLADGGYCLIYILPIPAGERE